MLTTIDGGAGANSITLSGGGQFRILTVGNATRINANNLNFTGAANINGGAIAIAGGGSLTLANSALYGNANNSPGGGLRCDSGCTANLTNVTLSANSSPNGGGISIVTLTDQTGATRTVRTSSFGFFRFDGVEVGQTYIISVQSKRFQFTPQVISVNEDLTELNFYSNDESFR